MPAELKAIGDHVRKRRLALNLRQKDVAEQIGVTEASVYGWEENRASPSSRAMSGIIEFLGYNPVPAPGSAWERLGRQRVSAGVS